MADTIFGKIVAGEIPCHKVYEDDRVLAFLDVNPLSRGHTLVVPKRAAERLEDLQRADAEALGRALPRVARAVLRATGAGAYNVLQNNGPEAMQSVMHVHYHIVPRYAGDSAGAGLLIDWKSGSLEGGEELAESIAGAIAEPVAD